MANDPLFFVVIGACVAVLLVLVTGIGVFGKGGELNHKYANKLMRLRIIAQGVAVALILLFVWLRGGS